MASFLRKARQRRCHFCGHVSASEAYESGICLRHQLCISLRLLFLLARQGRFGNFWRIVGWGR